MPSESRAAPTEDEINEATYDASIRAVLALAESMALVASAALRSMDEGWRERHLLEGFARDLGQTARLIDRLAAHAARAGEIKA